MPIPVGASLLAKTIMPGEANRRFLTPGFKPFAFYVF
jgi:hypothetical protein